MNASPWTAAEETTLRQGWAVGKSAGIIGEELNRTRNAVMGKVNRLHLVVSEARDPKRHQTVALAHRKPTKRLQATRRLAPTEVPATEPMSIVSSKGPVALMDLRRGHCRAVVDTTDPGNPKYCGRPRIKIGIYLCAYCAEHHAIYTQQSRY